MANDSRPTTILGAAHYWHDRWYRLRWWRAIGLVSLGLNAYSFGRLGGWF